MNFQGEYVLLPHPSREGLGKVAVLLFFSLVFVFSTSLAWNSGLSVHRTNKPLSFCTQAAAGHGGEPVVRRDRIVVSTLRCGRSNPGSNPGHGRTFLLSKGDVEPLFAASILQLDWWLKLSCVLCRPPSSQQNVWTAGRCSRGREVKAMDLKSIGVSPRRFEPCRLRANLPLLL